MRGLGSERLRTSIEKAGAGTRDNSRKEVCMKTITRFRLSNSKLDSKARQTLSRLRTMLDTSRLAYSDAQTPNSSWMQLALGNNLALLCLFKIWSRLAQNARMTEATILTQQSLKCTKTTVTTATFIFDLQRKPVSTGLHPENTKAPQLLS